MAQALDNDPAVRIHEESQCPRTPGSAAAADDLEIPDQRSSKPTDPPGAYAQILPAIKASEYAARPSGLALQFKGRSTGGYRLIALGFAMIAEHIDDDRPDAERAFTDIGRPRVKRSNLICRRLGDGDDGGEQGMMVHD
jgi:hypothetical protein